MERESVLEIGTPAAKAGSSAGVPAAERSPAAVRGEGRSPCKNQRQKRAFGLLLVLAGYALAVALSWHKWPDLLVDFGTQLYLPWQISTGSVLYRDVMYLTGGPLSQHYHALLFSLFGPSLLTVVISNLLLGLGLLVLMYRCFLASSDVWTATAICLAVALVFACNQYSNIGNFNFITPYCHEVWHGLVFSVVAVVLLSQWAQSSTASAESGMRPAAGAGFCGGLVFMTKPDMFLALSLAFLVVLILVGLARGASAVLKGFFCAIAAAALPLSAFFFWFHRFENWHDSMRSVAYAWAPLLGSSVSQQFFYKWCLGLDAPGFHLRVLVVHLVVLGVALTVLALACRQKLVMPWRRMLALGFVALLLALASAFDWVDCGRSLPVLCLALCLIAGRSLLRPPAYSGEEAPMPEHARPTIFPFVWAIFALALLAKLGFYSRIWHYGFALAMPAFAAALLFLLWFLPLILEKFGVNRTWFRGALTLLLAVGCLRLFVQSQKFYHTRTLPVGSQPDTVLVQPESRYPAGAAVRDALDWLEKNATPEASLAVLPEGVMINYLSRRVNPTRYLVWNPAELASFGQENMTEAFRSRPPDYVILVHRDASEYGADFFGRQKSFGGELLNWITDNYEPVRLIGKEPLRDAHFGLKILKRASSAARDGP